MKITMRQTLLSLLLITGVVYALMLCLPEKVAGFLTHTVEGTGPPEISWNVQRHENTRTGEVTETRSGTDPNTGEVYEEKRVENKKTGKVSFSKKTTYPDGGSHGETWDENTNLPGSRAKRSETDTDPLGNSKTTKWNKWGQKTFEGTSYGDGREEHKTYSPEQGGRKVTEYKKDGKGNTETKHYDSEGLGHVETTDGKGTKKTTYYGSDGKPSSVEETDRRGNKTRTNYDPNGSYQTTKYDGSGKKTNELWYDGNTGLKQAKVCDEKGDCREFRKTIDPKYLTSQEQVGKIQTQGIVTGDQNLKSKVLSQSAIKKSGAVTDKTRVMAGTAEETKSKPGEAEGLNPQPLPPKDMPIRKPEPRDPSPFIEKSKLGDLSVKQKVKTGAAGQIKMKLGEEVGLNPQPLPPKERAPFQPGPSPDISGKVQVKERAKVVPSKQKLQPYFTERQKQKPRVTRTPLPTKQMTEYAIKPRDPSIELPMGTTPSVRSYQGSGAAKQKLQPYVTESQKPKSRFVPRRQTTDQTYQSGAAGKQNVETQSAQQFKTKPKFRDWSSSADSTGPFRAPR